MVSLMLASCAASPSGPGAESSSPAHPEPANSPSTADFKELECSPDVGAEGVVGEIVPTATGEHTPEAALDAYFVLKDLPLASKDFVSVAETEGVVQLASVQEGKIEALAVVIQVESGGWIVGEFSSCQGFVEDHAV
jgi:hypothetical protein